MLRCVEAVVRPSLNRNPNPPMVDQLHIGSDLSVCHFLYVDGARDVVIGQVQERARSSSPRGQASLICPLLR